jgi:hypothetical protein
MKIENGLTLKSVSVPPQLKDVHGVECAMRLAENTRSIKDAIHGKFGT